MKLTERSVWTDEAAIFERSIAAEPVTILANVDGFVMCRRGEEYPFVIGEKEFRRRFTPATRAALAGQKQGGER